MKTVLCRSTATVATALLPRGRCSGRACLQHLQRMAAQPGRTIRPAVSELPHGAHGKHDQHGAGKGGIERDPRTLANHRFFAGDQLSMLRRSLHVSVELQRAPATVGAVHGVRPRAWATACPLGGWIAICCCWSRRPIGQAGRWLWAGPTLPPLAGEQFQGKPGRLYAKMLHDDGPGPAPFWP